MNAYTFQVVTIAFDTDAPTVEFRYRAVGGRYRLRIDGQDPESAPILRDPGGSGMYRTSFAFATRQLRHLELDVDSTRFDQIDVAKGDTVLPPEPAISRGVVLGDSYTEGTGATARFTTFAQSFCLYAGWDDCYASGTGGTGYLNPGPASAKRVKFRDRVAHDVIAFHPAYVLIAGGRNDVGFATPAAVQAEALSLFTQIKTALPDVRLVVTSPIPATGTEANAAGVLAIGKALKASADAVGALYLDLLGPNAYITGNGNVGAPNGTGNADYLTGKDKVHPTQAGHDELAAQLLTRYDQLVYGD